MPAAAPGYTLLPMNFKRRCLPRNSIVSARASFTNALMDYAKVPGHKAAETVKLCLYPTTAPVKRRTGSARDFDKSLWKPLKRGKHFTTSGNSFALNVLIVQENIFHLKKKRSFIANWAFFCNWNLECHFYSLKTEPKNELFLPGPKIGIFLTGIWTITFTSSILSPKTSFSSLVPK